MLLKLQLYAGREFITYARIPPIYDNSQQMDTGITSMSYYTLFKVSQKIYLFYFMCMSDFVCIICVPGTHIRQKRELDPLKLELQEFVSYRVSASNQAQVCCVRIHWEKPKSQAQFKFRLNGSILTVNRRTAASDPDSVPCGKGLKWGFKVDIRKLCIFMTVLGIHNWAGKFFFPSVISSFLSLQ